MTKFSKFVAKILGGRSDSNVDFDDLCNLLEQLGFEKRIRGSHHIYVMPGHNVMINMQRDGRMAKPYQVRQVRAALTDHGLVSDVEDE